MPFKIKMHDPILAKSFSRHDQKRLGCFATILCLSLVLSICIFFKPMFHHMSHVVNTVNSPILSIIDPQDTLRKDDTIVSKPEVNESKDVKTICTTSEPLSDYCEINGDIRIEGNSSTMFIVSDPSNIMEINQTSWTIKPYGRKGNLGALNHIKKWTIKLVQNHKNIPKCTYNHNIPAVLFSTGGYNGNFFHAFSDSIVPLYSTSQRFKGDVQFLVTNYDQWWISKYRKILSELSNHGILAIDQEEETHCYSNVVVGLKSNKELIINETRFTNASSMRSFRKFLRKTLSLERSSAINLQNGGGKRPRLMIISRGVTRRLLNEGEIKQMAIEIGYDVIVDEMKDNANVSVFANMVNSCDVLMGIHGAGLTNMVFLPENGVLIQKKKRISAVNPPVPQILIDGPIKVIPLGPIDIDWLARRYFEEPASDMKLNYLEYKIKVRESSLVEKFPMDHAVFKDPLSFHNKGWMGMKSIYLDQQDVKIDLHRFRSILIKAMSFFAEKRDAIKKPKLY